MKTFLNFLFVFSVFAIFSTGCEKESSNPDNLNPNKNALRISKIADNSAMQDPWWTFEYNEDGLVNKMTGVGSQDTIFVTYNNDDLPVKIVIVEVPYGNAEYANYDTIEISWSHNSFILNDGEYLNNDTYTLDANGRIVSIDDDYEARWQEDEAEIYYLGDGTEEWAQTRKLTEYYHPLSAINLAILNACGIYWVFDECNFTFQNKFCLSMNSSVDEGSAEYDYEYNDDGYPTELLIVETTDGGIYKFYFEYETD